MIKSILLYEHQKEICGKFDIQVYSKETDLEHTNHISFIIGINYTLASMKQYVKEINEMMEIDKGCIKIRKDFICEKDTKSKVFRIFCMESKAKEVNEVLTGLANKIIRYISYQDPIVEDRLAAMHANKIFNAKGRYKTLEDVNVKQIVKFNETQYEFGKLLKSIKKDQSPLFLAVEQGAGKFQNHANVIMNLRMKNEAKK